MTKDDGGPAFPTEQGFKPNGEWNQTYEPGMSLRDWFAGTMQEDDRLVKCIRSMDDHALEIFALHPELEREEYITETEVDFTNWDQFPNEVAKITRRLELEAKAIARVRYMQADAMLEERKK